MEGIPNLQQTSIPIAAPLMIPKTDHLNGVLAQKSFPLRATSNTLRQAMLKAIQLNRQFCLSTIKIQNIWADRVLSAELKTGETVSP